MPCAFAVIAITHDMVKLIFTTKLDSIGCFMYCNARWYLDCHCPNPFLSKKICYLVQNVQQHYQTNVLWIATEALRNDVKVPMQIKKHSCSTAICTPKAMIWTQGMRWKEKNVQITMILNLQQTPFCVINVPKNDQVSKINSTFCRSKWIAFVSHILNSWSNKVNFMADLNSKYVTIENKQHMHSQHRESASSHNLYTTQFQIT